MPQRISGPKNEKIFTKQLILVLSLMKSLTISRPECFVAEVAGDDNSFEVVCFNVIFEGTAHTFLSTNFAPMS